MTTNEATYYSLLEIAETATLDEIKTAYRRLAREYHPDTIPEGLRERRIGMDAADTFRILTEAYSVLTDRRSRAQYDEQLRGLRGQKRQSAHATAHTGTSPQSSSPPPPHASGPSASPSPSAPQPSSSTQASQQSTFGPVVVVAIILIIAAVVALATSLGTGQRRGGTAPQQVQREPGSPSGGPLVRGKRGDYLFSGWRACPGEAGCEFGDWHVRQRLYLYEDRSYRSPLMGVEPGTKVTGLDAILEVRHPGRAVATDDFTPQDGDHITVHRGDVFPYYYDMGEGCAKVSRGEVAYDLCGAPLRLERVSSHVLWLQLRVGQKVGWTDERAYLHGTSRYDDPYIPPSVAQVVNDTSERFADALPPRDSSDTSQEPEQPVEDIHIGSPLVERPRRVGEVTSAGGSPATTDHPETVADPSETEGPDDGSSPHIEPAAPASASSTDTTSTTHIPLSERPPRRRRPPS